MVWVGIEESSAHSAGDRATAVVLDRVSVLEPAAESASSDFLLIAFGSGPSVKDSIEHSGAHTWCSEVGKFGQEFGALFCLPGRCVLQHVRRCAVVFVVVLKFPPV